MDAHLLEARPRQCCPGALRAPCDRNISGPSQALAVPRSRLGTPAFLPPRAHALSSRAQVGEDITCSPVFPSRYLGNENAERLRFGAH